jgi:hypothetical protein
MDCRSIKGLGVIVVALSLPSLAGAQTFDVKQLDVKKGALELGLDNTVQAGISRPDANRSAHDQSLDYGVTDWWRLSGVIKLENPLSAEVRVARTAVENILVLQASPKGGGIGLGWFTSLEASTDPATTNSSQFGPIVVLQRDKLSFTANPFFEKTFGHNRIEGIALNYGWNAKYQINERLAIGVEGFGLIENLGNSPRFSDQQHRIGPALFTAITLGHDLTITPDIGIFFGLTEATPNVTLKLNVGVPLQQPPPRR